MLEGYFVHDCTVYRQTVDEYNDIRETNSRISACHFRDNTALNPNNLALNREEESSDAMAWFPPGEDVLKGDILLVEGSTYRIMRIVQARRLGETQVQFVKCWLERFEAFVS